MGNSGWIHESWNTSAVTGTSCRIDHTISEGSTRSSKSMANAIWLERILWAENRARMWPFLKLNKEVLRAVTYIESCTSVQVSAPRFTISKYIILVHLIRIIKVAKAFRSEIMRYLHNFTSKTGSNPLNCNKKWVFWVNRTRSKQVMDAAESARHYPKIIVLLQ